MYFRYNSVLPLLPDEKVGDVRKALPTFIKDAPNNKITVEQSHPNFDYTFLSNIIINSSWNDMYFGNSTARNTRINLI